MLSVYPVRQLHHVCRVYAEEDVQDFRQLRPDLDSPQVVVLYGRVRSSLLSYGAEAAKFRT